MHFRHAILILLISFAAITLAPAAPTPRRDWWLEVRGPQKSYHFVRVATGERKPVRTVRPEPKFEWTSPDGKWLAQAIERPDAAAPLKSAERDQDLFVRERDSVRPGRRIAQEVSNWTVKWTPDSKRIVYMAYQDGWRAFSAAVDGSDVRCLTQTAGFNDRILDFQLLPNGSVLHFGARKQVAFRRDRSAKSDWTVTQTCPYGHLVLADGHRDRFICRDEFVEDFKPSPDGRRIAYSVGGPRDSQLVLHDLETGRDERFQVNGHQPSWECRLSEIEWRPDGKALAFGLTLLQVFVEFPKEVEPFRHIGIVSLETDKPRIETVAFANWDKSTDGTQPLGYTLIRWVTDAEVEWDSKKAEKQASKQNP